MAPPKLDFFASGRPSPSDYHSITPRTPHSRAGRAEEAVTDVDLNDNDHSEFAAWRQQQAEPLLRSSASDSFSAGYRSRGDDYDEKRSYSAWSKHISWKSIAYNVPLVAGILASGFLLYLIALSFWSPGKLEEFVGYSGTPSVTAQVVDDLAATVTPAPTPSYIETNPPPGHLISYENYTKFPLTGSQYEQECYKMMGGKFMHHRGYWIPNEHGIMDVPHHDDITDYHLPEGERTTVCSKTITYQLDGHVGLVADLALMAQAAALAREVSPWLFHTNFDPIAEKFIA